MQNCNSLTEAVVYQRHEFFGNFKHFPSEERVSKMTLRADAQQFQDPLDILRLCNRLTARSVHTTVHQILAIALHKKVLENYSQDQQDVEREKCLEYLESIENDSSVLERVADVFWVFGYDPKAKLQSME